MHSCQHCGHDVTGHFCSNCGQRKIENQLSYHHIRGYLASEIFTFESKLFRTIKDLFTRPGHVINTFLSGDHTSYYNPIKYFLLMGALNIFFRYVIDFDAIYDELANLILPADAPEQARQTFENGRRISHYMNYLAFILVGMMSAFIRLFQTRSKYRFIDYLILSFYGTGHVLFFGIIILALAKIHPSFIFAQNIILVIYFIFILMSFFQKRSFTSLLKYIFISILGVVSYTLVIANVLRIMNVFM